MKARPAPEPIRVLIVDSGGLEQAAVRQVLEPEPDITIVGEGITAASARDAVEALEPDVLVVTTGDMGLSIEIAVSSRLTAPAVEVVLTGVEPEAEEIMDAVEAGISGFLTGASSLQDVGEAVRVVARGEAVLPTHLLGPVIDRMRVEREHRARLADRLARLTAKQREVLDLLVAGFDNRQISKELGITPATVQTHVRDILARMEVHSRLEITALLRGGPRSRTRLPADPQG
jgi:DNA-binding NarL/FixJ family response regulator